MTGYLDPEQSRAYMTLYRETHREEIRAQRMAYRATHKVEQQTYLAAWKQTKAAASARKRAYEKKKADGSKTARQLVYDAVRAGKLTKLPCLVCGAELVEAHHRNGYVGAARYEVDWLCRTHHEEVHHGALEGEKAYTR